MLLEAVRQFVTKHGIEPCGIVAAVSGGPDSVALLLTLLELQRDGFRITCGHINHHLRGADSEADEAFVRELCGMHGVELHVADGTLDPAAVKARGIEAAAREIRTERLNGIRRAVDARFIATAHQKNDQAETVLIRLFRGSGLAGLRGIHPVREDGFIRPLLACSRDDIERFLAERNITARHDISNDDPRFFRNRVRRMLRHFDAPVIHNVAAVADQASDHWRIVSELLDRCEVDATADQTRFSKWPDDPWLRQALLHRHILRLDPAARDVSAIDLARIASELPSVRRLSVTKNLELVRRGEDLMLRRRIEPTPQFECELAIGIGVFVPEIGATVSISCTRNRQPATSTRSRQLFQLPDGAPDTFIIRNRRDGDRFQPLGMSVDKKLKDFLIDRKIAAEERDSLPLLVWNDQIVWVGGVEISERFKVTDPAAELYEVRLERNGTITAGEEGVQR